MIGGKLTGVLFEKVKAECDEKGRRKLVPTGEPDPHFACDDVLVAVGQENAFPVDRARYRHRVRPLGHARGRRDHDAILPAPRVLRRRRRLRAEEHHLGRGARPRRGDLDRQVLHGEDVRDRPPPGVPGQPEDGHPRVELRQRHLERRCAIACRCATRRSRSRTCASRSNSAIDEKLGYLEAERCLNCDVQTVFTGRCASNATHASTSARWIASPSPTMARKPSCAARLNAPAAQRRARSRTSAIAEDRTHHGQGRGCVPALRSVRRALPDRRVGHAANILDRHEPYAWPGRSNAVNADSTATSTTSSSSSPTSTDRDRPAPTQLFAKSILRMGIPAPSRNIFPSNIQGLPTWFEVRVSERAISAAAAASI